jgi:uncharacterized protein
VNSQPETGPSPQELARIAADAAADKKARDIVILDMRGLVVYTDFMVVCTGNTPRQTAAIADEIRRVLKEDHGVRARRVEGEREAEWILMDYLDFVVHIFTPQAREFYRLDRLWGEAPQQVLETAASWRPAFGAGRRLSLSALDLGFVGVAALAAGAVNALAGGGTLITFPALTAVGVPALNANITNTVALSPGYVGGTIAQKADLEGQRPRVKAVAIPAVVGGLCGGALLLAVGATTFRALVPWLILIATLLLAVDPLAKRWVRRRLSHPHGHGSLPLTATVAFVGAVYGGFFGAGLGIILLALYSLVVPDTLIRINALKQATSFVANVTASLFFVFSGKVVWEAAVVMAVGALVGGVAAGRVVRFVHPGVLRVVVVVIGLVVAAVYFVK